MFVRVSFHFSSSVLGSAGDSVVCMHDHPDAALLGTERAWICKFECESTFRQNRGVRISPFRCGTTCRTMTLPEFQASQFCLLPQFNGCLRVELGFRLLARGSPSLDICCSFRRRARRERERELLLKKRECAWLLPILSGSACVEDANRLFTKNRSRRNGSWVLLFTDNLA